MTQGGRDLIIGIDAGTSVIKSVAFTLTGQQVAAVAVPNRYTARADGAAYQPLAQTWEDCAQTLRELTAQIGAERVAAVAVTAQGDGTWLVGAGNAPVTDGWLWLDARSAPAVNRLRAQSSDIARFASTGTGLNCCQMGSQLAHMDDTTPEMLDQSEVALHCKDWLYLNLTGVRATDPSEANFTFGNYSSRDYNEDVIAALGLSHRRNLLPPIVDGTQTTHPLTAEAAAQTGLLAGTPVSLAYVDVVCTAMGAGIYTPGQPAGCTIVGSTGMHMRATPQDGVQLNDGHTGYVMVLPVPGYVAQIQSNMASTLNIDWLLKLAADLMADMGQTVTHRALVDRIDGWLGATSPASILYHPYISEAGERGPIVNSDARAAFNGLSSNHRFPDLLRAVIEGLGYSSRDCYDTMGDIPAEIRLTGGAVRSKGLRRIMSAALDRPVRAVSREEAGAAGAAMMAAVAIGAYRDMDACVNDWVLPTLGQAELPDPHLATLYSDLFPAYRSLRIAAEPVWATLAAVQEKKNV